MADLMASVNNAGYPRQPPLPYTHLLPSLTLTVFSRWPFLDFLQLPKYNLHLQRPLPPRVILRGQTCRQ